MIKSRSIRKEDNPEYYQERLKELQSEEFVNAVYAYSVRSKMNERNAIKLKEIARKSKEADMVNSSDRCWFYTSEKHN